MLNTYQHILNKIDNSIKDNFFKKIIKLFTLIPFFFMIVIMTPVWIIENWIDKKENK